MPSSSEIIVIVICLQLLHVSSAPCVCGWTVVAVCHSRFRYLVSEIIAAIQPENIAPFKLRPSFPTPMLLSFCSMDCKLLLEPSLLFTFKHTHENTNTGIDSS